MIGYGKKTPKAEAVSSNLAGCANKFKALCEQHTAAESV
jgi:hypothetical protein